MDNKTLAMLALVSIFGLTGCDNDDDPPCENVGTAGGCTSSAPYSCSGADYCYQSRNSCEVSSECD